MRAYNILVWFPSNLFSGRFVCLHEVQPNSCIDTVVSEGADQTHVIVSRVTICGRSVTTPLDSQLPIN